jgi:hypothetical protein
LRKYVYSMRWFILETLQNTQIKQTTLSTLLLGCVKSY